MDYFSQLLALAGIILLGCASPGPDFVAVTSHALNNRRSGVFVGLGIASAVVVWATLAILGFGLLIKELYWLYEAIRLAGAIYLVYLGSRMLMGVFKGKYDQQNLAGVSTVGVGQSWRIGFVVGITNPKTATFFATLFVTLLPVGAPPLVYIAVVAMVGVITSLWLCLLASVFSIGRVRSIYASIRRPVDALMGAVLVGLGVRMATGR
ncbi:MAG: LysE family translocator [Advenella sp.]|uniref:Lysine transporter LysE n=1 Tax=Advenella kashmirensis TaxID=310575 RepID=A0A356LEN3_9BURK|nr:LysE family transporter [Advenella sp. FME57]HBP29362.1 lysine transporter LysE [Advenella kashmirensis]